MTVGRFTSLGLEVLAYNDPKVRFTSLGLEVLGHETTPARVTALVLEVLADTNVSVPSGGARPIVMVAT